MALTRVYRAPQIGVGTTKDPIHSILNDLINLADGDWFDEIDHPVRKTSMCVVVASEATHVVLAAHPDVTIYSPFLEQYSLDTPFSVFPAALREKAQTRLEADGVSTSWITGTNTVRDVLRYILRVNVWANQIIRDRYPTAAEFLLRNLGETVAQLTQDQRNGARDWMQGRGLAIGWINNQTTVREIAHFVVMNLGFGKIRIGGHEF